jgi:hypothetical protein
MMPLYIIRIYLIKSSYTYEILDDIVHNYFAHCLKIMHMHNLLLLFISIIIICLTQDILFTSFYANTFDPQKSSKVTNNNNKIKTQ